MIGGNRAKDQLIEQFNSFLTIFKFIGIPTDNRPDAFQFILMDASKKESSLVI